MKWHFEDIKSICGKIGRLLDEGRYRVLTAWVIYMVAIFLYQGLFSWGIWERALAAAVTSTVLSTGLLRLHRDYVGGLRYRIRAGSNEPAWQAWVVQMNDVNVGRVTDAEYAQMRLDVANDPRVYVTQLANMVRGCFSVLSSGYAAVPIGAFWVLLALAIVSPSTLVGWLATARAQTPSELAAWIAAGATVLATSLVVTVAVCHLLDIATFGFANCFDLAFGKLVRQRLGITAEGKLVLTLVRFANPSGESGAAADQACLQVRRYTVDR